MNASEIRTKTILSPSTSQALVPHVCSPHFAAKPNPGRGAPAPKLWAANSTGDEMTWSCLLSTCTQAEHGCKHAQAHNFPYAQYQPSTDFNRIKEIESKEETEELRKAQEDANAAPGRAGMT